MGRVKEYYLNEVFDGWQGAPNIVYKEDQNIPIKNRIFHRRPKKQIKGQVIINPAFEQTNNTKDLTELPKTRCTDLVLTTNEHPINKYPAYLKSDTVNMLMERTKFTGDESEFLKTLVIFTPKAEILFEKGDKPCHFLIPVVAHIVEPRDDEDVPFGCNWYQVISSFVNNDKMMARMYVKYLKSDGENIRNLSTEQYFFANPNQVASINVSLSKFSKNGFGK